MLDDRAKLLLKTLVERYIAEGSLWGHARSRARRGSNSPATIRNVMSDLEALGLITSPHTSAGRIPTARGYRLFVDTMLTAQRDQLPAPSLPPDQPQKVIANAAHLLSSLSQFVGVVMAPRRTSVFKQIEFLRLSDRRLLVIIVSPDGDVQNRVIFPSRITRSRSWSRPPTTSTRTMPVSRSSRCATGCSPRSRNCVERSPRSCRPPCRPAPRS